MRFIGCLLTLAFLGVAGFVLFQMYEAGQLRPEKLRAWLEQPGPTNLKDESQERNAPVPPVDRQIAVVIGRVKEGGLGTGTFFAEAGMDDYAQGNPRFFAIVLETKEGTQYLCKFDEKDAARLGARVGRKATIRGTPTGEVGNVRTLEKCKLVSWD